MNLLERSLVALGLLVCVGCGADPKALVERGNRFADAGKYDDAIIQYRKALQKSPTLGEAQYRLGLAELSKNQPVQAFNDLRRASELMPDDEKVLAALGDLSLSLYNADRRHPQPLYDEANKAADRLLGRNVYGFEGNRLKGALALVNRKPEDAIDYLRKADKAKPGDPQTTLGLAGALVLNNQTQAGLDMALGLIQKNKAAGQPYDFLFQQYQAAHRTQDAEDILKLKAANNPKRVDFTLELARYYAATSRPADMQATLQKILDHPADFPDSRMRVGDFYAAIGKADEATRYYQEGLTAKPKDPAVYRKRLTRVLVTQRKLPEALQQVDAILKATPNDQETKLARALIWLEQGKPENLDPAITELQAQVQLKSQDPVLRYQLGMALSRKSDAAGALREWTAAAQMNRNYMPPRFALATLQLSQGRPQEALQRSEEILTANPRNPEARLLNAVCLMSAGKFTDARARLDRLISDFPKLLSARYQLGVLAISEKNYGEAESIFQELQKNAADSPQVIAGLAEAYRGQNQSGRALQLLQDEIKRTPNSQPIRGLLARFAAVSGNPDMALEQYRQMLAANPKSVDIQLAMGQVYETKGDYASAIPIFEKAAQSDPKSVSASLMLAQVLGMAGKTSDAKAPYRHVLELQPDNPRAMNNLAFLMLETGDNADEALKLAQRGLLLANEPALKNSLTDTVGWAYLKKKMYEPALQTFQVLVTANPANATFHYHLGAAFYGKGDKRQARVELESALADKPAAGDEPKIRDLLTHL